MPPRLLVFRAIAPLLPPDACAAPGALERVLDDTVSAGYDGVEAQVSQILLAGPARFGDALAARRLRLIGKIYSSGGPSASPHAAGVIGATSAGVTHPCPGPSVAEHLAVWCAQLEELARGPPSLVGALVSVSSQGGRDAFHAGGGAQADAFLTGALDAAEALRGAGQLTVPVHHETHRHRCLFSPWHAVDAVAAHPRLRLLADLSHFSVVCEVPCGEPALEAAVAALLPRVGHVHARVGFEQGPQVADPRAPGAAAQLAGFTAWWVTAWRHAVAAGADEVTATPEFLPAPYCPARPDGTPVADVEEINVWMAGHLRRAFAEAKF